MKLRICSPEKAQSIIRKHFSKSSGIRTYEQLIELAYDIMCAKDALKGISDVLSEDGRRYAIIMGTIFT